MIGGLIHRKATTITTTKTTRRRIHRSKNRRAAGTKGLLSSVTTVLQVDLSRPNCKAHMFDRTSLSAQSGIFWGGLWVIYGIIERRVRKTFALPADDIDRIIGAFAPRHRHWLPGDHALSGVRSHIAATRDWYERAARLMPDLTFEVHRVSFNGPLWRLWIEVEWTSSATINGDLRNRHGRHRLQLAWGKMKIIEIYADPTEMVEDLSDLAAKGQAEAAYGPIGTPNAMVNL